MVLASLESYHFSMPENFPPQYPQPNYGQPPQQYYPPQQMPQPYYVPVPQPIMTQQVNVQLGVRPRHGLFWLMGQLMKWSLLFLFWPFALAWYFREDIGRSIKAHPIGWAWGGIVFGVISLFAGAIPVGLICIVGCAVPIVRRGLRNAGIRRARKAAEDAAIAARADAQHQAVLADDDYGTFGTNDPTLTHAEPKK